MFENIIHIILFYGLSIIMIISALGIIFLPKLLHACISMFVCFFAVGMLFILLNSDFLGVIQIGIYSVAVCILFAIIIMLSGQNVNKFDIKALIPKTIVSLISVSIIFAVLLFSITNGFSLFDRFSKPFSMVIDISDLGIKLPAGYSIQKLAENLLSKYIFAFELISVIILVVLAGIVVLNAKNKGETKNE